MSTKTVKMLGKISGSRNGKPWPEVGGTIDLPTAEADALIASRIAVDPAAVETATVPAAETATVPGNRSVRQIAQEKADAAKAEAAAAEQAKTEQEAKAKAEAKAAQKAKADEEAKSAAAEKAKAETQKGAGK